MASAVMFRLSLSKTQKGKTKIKTKIPLSTRSPTRLSSPGMKMRATIISGVTDTVKYALLA